MLKAVLFDLDGTLLPMDQNKFVQHYCQLLAGRVAHVVEPQQFIKHLLAATAAMVADIRPEYTNEQVFAAHFYSGPGIAAEKLLPIFADFYERDFGQLMVSARPSAIARIAVQAVIEQGLMPVIATNPIFPLTAVRQRLAWANIADLPFQLVTSYEASHFCKPQIAYYQEILNSIDCRPEECLMVGNDVEEDLVAAKLGIKTYLVTDCMINNKNLVPIADYCGSLAEMADFLTGSDLRNL